MGEFDFISWVRSQQTPSPRVPVGPGDDLAAVRFDGAIVIVGADQVLDGVHFDSRAHSPWDIGRKAMNRNLSDCAAMAAAPVAAVATVALPHGFGLEQAKQLYLGIKSAGDEFGVRIVGGDTGTWGGPLALSVTILAEPAHDPLPLRCHARRDEGIFVTGPLGGSILGRHMRIAPRIVEGIALARRGVGAMIDLSDGLSRDLAHVCRESNVGAVIFADRVPVHPDAVQASRDGRSPLLHALHDGEDYELLFTADARQPWGHPQIGATTAEPGIWLQHADGRRERLEPMGWHHRL